MLRSGEENNIYATGATNEFLKFVRKNADMYVEEHKAPKNGEHLVKIMQTC